MKKCKTCGDALDISFFYKHDRMLDGHLNICKSCTKKRIHEHRRLNIKKIRAYDRARGLTEKRKAERREYVSKNKDKLLIRWRIRNAKWNKENRRRKLIYSRLRSRVKSGKIKQLPCVRCGDIKSQAHHHDYRKPFSVTWLCITHHHELHREEREKQRGMK